MKNSTEEEKLQVAGGIWRQIQYDGVGENPAPGSTVRVNYNAYFEYCEEPYDSTYMRRRQFEFRLGRCEVLPGLDFAVSVMKRRERAKFIISSDLLYGKLGCKPRIPANAWSLFIIELVSSIDCTLADELSKLSATEHNNTTFGSIDADPNGDGVSNDGGEQTIVDFDKRIRISQTLRDMGNEEYAKNNLDKAIRNYAKAKQFLLKSKLLNEEQEKQHQQLLLKLYLNSAQCYLKLRNPERTIKNCNSALQIDPNNIKALYRISISHRMLQQFDQAKTQLTKAITIEPYNHDVAEEFIKLERAIEHRKTTEQQMYIKMFNTTPSASSSR